MENWDGVLVYFMLLWQNATDQAIYKEMKFISHSCGGWEVQDQSVGM
jgi:hypothetical protein